MTSNWRPKCIINVVMLLSSIGRVIRWPRAKNSVLKVNQTLNRLCWARLSCKTTRNWHLGYVNEGTELHRVSRSITPRRHSNPSFSGHPCRAHFDSFVTIKSPLDIMSFCKSRELQVISAFFQQPPSYKPLSLVLFSQFTNMLSSPVHQKFIMFTFPSRLLNYSHTADTLSSCASLCLPMLKCRRPFRLACNGIHELSCLVSMLVLFLGK